MKKTEKDFKNMIVMNYGYVYDDAMDDKFLKINKGLTNNKWFDYVISDEVAQQLKTLLDSKDIDKNELKKIVHNNVLNSRNMIFSSLNERKAIDHAQKLSEKTLVLKLQ